MTRPLRLFRSLPCAIFLLALILSAAAWGAHSVTHGLDLAAATANVSSPADHRNAPDPDKQDGGHDHLQGFSFPVAALFDGSSLEPPPLPAAAPPIAQVATLALRAADPPLPDPPRTA
jgi:hypothetical protein